MNEREIFQAALDFADLTERQAWLHQACGTDLALRKRVDALLTAHEAASRFLHKPAVAGHPLMPTVMQEPGSELDNGDDEFTSVPDISFLSPSTKPGSIGTLGHYEILQVLGQGAFGIVFKAFDEKLHRLVAIKTMNPQLAATSPPRKRFLREARSVAAVNHENIVQIHAVEELPLPYLVMEYVAGQTLQQKLDGTGPLDIGEFLYLGRQMAAGLAAAHEKGLIHRDIKPGNILIEEGAEQKVKITDFGLARAADDATMTRTGTIAGTPMYMAPEQAMGQPLDHRADIFSLGSVLYQMACGRPPFRGPNAIAVLKRVVDEQPRPVREILSEVPDWLCRIIEKLHAKRPDDRYQTARELAELLTRCKVEWELTGTVTAVAPRSELSVRAPGVPASVPSREPISGNSIGPALRPAPVAALPAPSSKTWRDTRVFAFFVMLIAITVGWPAFHAVKRFIRQPHPAVANSPGGTLGQSNTQTRPGVGGPTIAGHVDIDFNNERKNAEWLLGHGGTVTVESLKGWDSYDPGKPLPREPFVVRTISVHQAATLSDVDLARLAASPYIEEVTFLNAKLLTANSVPILARLPRLKLLNLAAPRVTTSALEGLRESRSLHYLKITGDMIDDQLKFLPKLSTLRWFHIYDWRSVRPDLKNCAEAKQIRTLELAVANPPDQSELAALRVAHGALRILYGLESFRALDPDPVHAAAKALIARGIECTGEHALTAGPQKLSEANFVDGTCWSINAVRVPATVQLTNTERELLLQVDARHVIVEGPRDADELAKGLSQSQRLATLTLQACDLTDAGLVHLQSLPGLRALSVPHTKVSAEGIQRLRTALPGTSIATEFGTYESQQRTAMEAFTDQ